MSESRRKDMMQRIQIGLTGLAGVVLLVGLANIVIEKAGVNDETAAGVTENVPAEAAADADNATAPESAPAPEPLAELGVTPPSSTTESKEAKSRPAPAPVVPDLKPNPALKKPMDKEP